jgi:uncharacterized protein (TIGR03084 family)
MADDRSILDEYEAEQRSLYTVLTELSAEQWELPTPAAGWSVRDQVSHLADTEELAHGTATGGPRRINDDVARFPSGEAFTQAGCDRGRAMVDGPAVLEWWWSAAAVVRAGLAALPSETRVPWGLGMGWRAFVTARLMEHWAHGLDIRAAVGVESQDTNRLRHVAWIGVGAVPYAFGVAGVEAPAGHSVRFELTAPSSDEVWTFGPPDATDRITGPAGQWCRLAVQRTARSGTPDLVAEGPLADLVLDHARAFL